jgi:hypothetical protein
MFTPLPQGGPVIDSSLQVYYDFALPESYLPGTTYVNDIGWYKTNTGSFVGGGPIWRPDFGGCVEYDGIDDNITYQGALSASFTIMVATVSSNASAPNTYWTNDDGGFPGFRPANNGYIGAVQNSRGQIAPVIFFGTSGATLGNCESINTTDLVTAGYPSFATCFTFSTSGVNRHVGYLNFIREGLDTSTRTRGNSAIGTINIGRDPVLTRFPIGRCCAYLHYNRELTKDEVLQNHQYFQNRFGTRR